MLSQRQRGMRGKVRHRRGNNGRILWGLRVLRGVLEGASVCLRVLRGVHGEVLYVQHCGRAANGAHVQRYFCLLYLGHLRLSRVVTSLSAQLSCLWRLKYPMLLGLGDVTSF